MESHIKSDRYEVQAEVGRGGMGVVYRARDLSLGRTVALKMLPAELLNRGEYRRRLAQEARAASSLSHPGVATVYDYVEQPEESYLVSEFVEGTTLRARLRERRFDSDEILDIGVRLADALAAAHEHGVVHRDLKPENIMLTGTSERSPGVKILDFGLAKLQHPLIQAGSGDASPTVSSPASTAPGTLVGTVNYMSPEQLEGEPADHRADIYALGLVLYEMAAGTHPFVGKTPTSTIANILKQDAPPLVERNPVAPAELDRILRKCLRKQRAERYQSARELLVDLSNLQRERLSGSRSAPALPALRPEEQPILEIPRGLARALFLLIQIAYLVLYAAAFYYYDAAPPAIRAFLAIPLAGKFYFLLLIMALPGMAIRLYAIPAVTFDYAGWGRIFGQMFPLVLVVDLVWASAPLILYLKLGVLVLLFVPPLAYLPFSQRTLVLSAYSSRGGRLSGISSHGPS